MKEDETRGSARMNPRHYKGDVMTQTWIDSRILATLSVWLDTEGIMTRFLSEVMRETLEMVVANLVKDGKIKMVEDTDEARNMLKRRYRINLNAKGKTGKDIGWKNLSHNQSLSCRRVESGEISGYNPASRFIDDTSFNKNTKVDEPPVQTKGEPSEQPKNNRAIDNVSKEDLDKMVEIMKEKEYEDIVKKAKAEVEIIKDNADIDENGVITPKGIPRGPIYEDEYNAFKEEERKREKWEENDKEIKRIGKRMEKKKNKLDDLREKEEDDE
jgi:hypothetical protein